MDFVRYLSLFVVFFFDTIESGGHGGSHDHIKLYVPEIHHHKHHTKYITIHHHHKKPKKEHHHHHHHHHKPHVPHHHYGYHHTKKGHKTQIKTTTTHVGGGHGHKHHGHKHHSHKHHGHKHHGHKEHGHHHHHGHGHHHHEPPAPYDPPVAYDPPVSYDHDYSLGVPSVPSIPVLPKVHGITHTVKKVNVYDSLPGAIPGGKGYEVTEDSDEEDSFSSVNDIGDVYPSTYNFLRSAAPESPARDPISLIPGPTHGTVSTRDPFSPDTQSVTASDAFAGNDEHDPYPALQGHNAEFHPDSEDIPVSFNPGSEQGLSFGSGESFAAPATGISNDVNLSPEENFNNEDTPVTFSREAGIQHSVKTGGQETVVY